MITRTKCRDAPALHIKQLVDWAVSRLRFDDDAAHAVAVADDPGVTICDSGFDASPPTGQLGIKKFVVCPHFAVDYAGERSIIASINQYAAPAIWMNVGA